MKLMVYKGFEYETLKQMPGHPLVNGDISEKKNVLAYTSKTRHRLQAKLLDLIDNDAEAWITYEEYSYIHKTVENACIDEGLTVEIIRNNLLPDAYLLEFYVTSQLYEEIETNLAEEVDNTSPECKAYLEVFSQITRADEAYYGIFYNYETETPKQWVRHDFYQLQAPIERDESLTAAYNILISDDRDSYLRDFEQIKQIKPATIGVRVAKGETAQKLCASFLVYCAYKNIRVLEYHETLQPNDDHAQEYITIAQEDLHIPNFKGFRKIKFYQNPDHDKSLIEISQSQIIGEIVRQVEAAYTENGNFRDIFITASTGAGKSVMFQVPAVYLGKHYHKLTIIIEPVKALMQDQKENLEKRGYHRVEVFNSDLITQLEKEAVLKRIRDGEIDLLYLSPETLLSYSLDTLIGEREVGLMIVDEAHIVTTWGMGFRPDYWYLGGYISKLRNRLYYTQKGARIHHFPLCAFTATAVNGGEDDSVSETIISLAMENPVKYLGYVRRDDIKFNINCRNNGQKLNMSEYRDQKVQELVRRQKAWLIHNFKTVVYFPYAAQVEDAKLGVNDFALLPSENRIGTYSGSTHGRSQEADIEYKRDVVEKFRHGKIMVMFATKAFGMGIDINDIKVVYHYAVSGNLFDYVQEIGRAARKDGMIGFATADFYANDMAYTDRLFGMSSIRQWQINQVLAGVYETYKNKGNSRNFLISPATFTYIFGGHSEDQGINKLKTCLMMLEKDLESKYGFKVLIARPTSVFTKAFVVIDKEHEEDVRCAKYGGQFTFAAPGRVKSQQGKTIVSDRGDVWTLDLKKVWENFYANLSFPQFKYYYFSKSVDEYGKLRVMPEIREYIHPRQRLTLELQSENENAMLSEIRERMLQNFDYVAGKLHSVYGHHTFFTANDFAKLLESRFGKPQNGIIAHSLLELVDPDGKCVKKRDSQSLAKRKRGEGTEYRLADGTFGTMMEKIVKKSSLLNWMSEIHSNHFDGFIPIPGNAVTDNTSRTLKLFSIFGYATYALAGGEDPEIFIRLNDPRKVRNIVRGNMRGGQQYRNSYVTQAGKKHKRDMAVLEKFFIKLSTDEERWNYIEDYFLGHDVLDENHTNVDAIPVKQTGHNTSAIPLSQAIDEVKSYSTTNIGSWQSLHSYIDEAHHQELDAMENAGIPLPGYVQTKIKDSDIGYDILMCWPSHDALLCNPSTKEDTMKEFESNGWSAFKIDELDLETLKEVLG